MDANELGGDEFGAAQGIHNLWCGDGVSAADTPPKTHNAVHGIVLKILGDTVGETKGKRGRERADVKCICSEGSIDRASAVCQAESLGIGLKFRELA